MTESFVKVALVTEVANGHGMKVFVNNKSVALFRVDDRFFATQNTCPHLGASLHCGKIEGAKLTCPDHDWTFSLETGRMPMNPDCSLLLYDVEVRGDEVWVSRLARLS